MSDKSLVELLLSGEPRLDAMDVVAINARDRVAGQVLGIDHVQIAVPPGGEGDCRIFYLQVLGLREIERPKTAEGRSFLWARAGLNELHFRVDPEFKPAQFAHPGLIVADAAFLAAYLESVGWAIERGEAVKPGRFHVRDPFGNRLEFIDVSKGR
jgi:catechol 2,3-dioxygenase-like lactoylglutathione lyase family enzyme